MNTEEFQIIGFNRDRTRRPHMTLGSGRTMEEALLDYTKTLSRWEKTNCLDILATFERVRIHSKAKGFSDEFPNIISLTETK